MQLSICVYFFYYFSICEKQILNCAPYRLCRLRSLFFFRNLAHGLALPTTTKVQSEFVCEIKSSNNNDSAAVAARLILTNRVYCQADTTNGRQQENMKETSRLWQPASQPKMLRSISTHPLHQSSHNFYDISGRRYVIL